jgi:hypothetical protein
LTESSPRRRADIERELGDHTFTSDKRHRSAALSNPFDASSFSADARMEKEVGNLQRDAKTYLDALRCECAAHA